ncbi:DUF2971 domain-containing protein [Aeromonas hydrophila]|uniref:DUF2971 domain-containing protein n=1 Tax=Aeromonas hydrophila TaxID=644 RepID=UPI003985D249
MNIIYKYLNIFDIDYFTEPTMKISVPEHFNDPFESAISTKTDEIIKYYLKDIYMMNKYDISTYYEKTRHYIDYKISSNGIISLTRKNDDILMWSHYADNHKGMCIGLEEDFANHKAETGLLLDDPLLPIPVSYNQNRLDINKAISIDRFAHDLYRAQVLNKYEEWKYEQEERILIPIQFADSILIQKSDEVKKIKFINNIEYEHSISEWIPKILSDKLLKEVKNHNKTYYKRGENLEMSLHSTFEMYLGRFEEAIFLMNIPKQKIKEVYFGCKTPESTINKIHNQIIDPRNNLEHVKLFKFSLSPNKFELLPNKIQ